MVTYIIRRLLYSIPVLFAASFLIFTFVSVSGDPLAHLKHEPGASQDTISTSRAEAPRRADPVRYVYWLQDAVTDKFGTTLVGDRHDLARPQARDGAHAPARLPAAEIIAILLAIAIGVYSAFASTRVFDYAATTFSFLGLATPVFWLALMLQVLFIEHLPEVGTCGSSTPRA